MTPTCPDCDCELETEDEQASGFCRVCEAAMWERAVPVERRPEYFREAAKMVEAK